MLENIGRYIFKERIGVGGQATVYLAEDPELHRDVAVKVMHQMASEETAYLDTLREEARLSAGLSHQNIATVYDFQVQDGYACIVMEYFPNSLDRHLLSAGVMTQSSVAGIAAQICDALSYAHGRGFVHRDIKPHNILLDSEGTPKVTDFGLARATGLSEAATAIGTHFYMAPEQWRADEAPDVRSDIYALGVTMYEMLAGHPPFQGTAYQLPQMHLNEPMPDFDDALGVPSGLADIVRKCMEKDPGDRFQSAKEVASTLRALSEAPSSGARGASPMGRQGLPEPMSLSPPGVTGEDRGATQYSVR